MSRYRFVLRPKWILSHLFVLALVVLMVNLGFWQLRRLHEKRSHNALVSARSRAPVAPLGRVLTAADRFGDAAPVEFRRVTASGRYRPDQELLVRSRSLDGAPGSWVMTPLVLGDGSALVVNRGWIANEGRYDAVPDAFRAPSGRVTVTGLLRRTETRGSYGPKDPTAGRLPNLARADIGRMAKQLPEPLVPGWVQLQVQRPTSGAAPRLLPTPQLDEGPHFSYAIQWFLFSTIAVVGYPLILRRRAGELAGGGDDGGGHDSQALDRPDPDDVLRPDDPRLDPLSGPRGPTLD